MTTEIRGAAPLEREVKLRFESPESARAAVVALGATPIRPRRLQSDVLFDTPSRMLSARGQVLRVRVEEGQSSVTFKSPVLHPTLKLREEFETGIADGGLMVAILEHAGFQIWFRYEKYREEFSLPGVIIAIDETPVGAFVEIEGSESGITTVVSQLGRAHTDFIVDSYRTLYVRFCEARGIPVSHMLFDPPR